MVNQRINAAKKRVLQFRDRVHDLESGMGREKVFTNEWRDLSLAKSLELTEEERFLWMQDMLYDLVDILHEEMSGMSKAFVESFKGLAELMRQISTEDIGFKGEPRI